MRFRCRSFLRMWGNVDGNYEIKMVINEVGGILFTTKLIALQSTIIL